MENSGYEKRGYLYDDFRMFHIMDAGIREYPYHYHDFYKLLIFLKGSITYSIEGKSYKLKAYDMVRVNKGAIHRPQVESKEPYERIVFYISEAFLKRHRTTEYNLARCFEMAGEEGADVLRFPAMTNSRLLSVIEEIEKNGQEKEQYAAKLYANVLFMEFMILVNQSCMDGTATFNRAVYFNQKMIDLIKYIGEHLTEELSIEYLAAHFYISRFHMMRQFKEETGYTIHRYITEKRVLLAKSLMAAGIAPTQACYQSGFRDYSTFSRAYKRRLAQNPSESSHEQQ